MNELETFKNLENESGEKKDGFFSAFVGVFAAVLVLFFLFVSFVSLCNVHMSSMENTIFDKDNVLLFKTQNVKINDIVVVSVTDSSNKKTDIIKRVVGVGGDKLYFKEVVLSSGKEIFLFRNGEKIDESGFIKEKMNYANVYDEKGALVTENNPLTVPKNHFYVLGDNRNISQDSRVYGFIPKSTIVGKYFYTLKKDSLLEKLFLFIY